MRGDPSAEVVHACVAVTLQREDAAVLVRDTQLVIDLMMRLQVRPLLVVARLCRENDVSWLFTVRVLLCSTLHVVQVSVGVVCVALPTTPGTYMDVHCLGCK